MNVEQCRRIIAAKNRELNAVLTVLDEPLFGEGDALAGVPYVLKDTWDTAGIRTTGGSWRHRARVPSESARPFEALKKTGAVLLGKSNLCDLAFSAESDNHMLGPVRNPHDPSRTAGGSTGGGAAAVASGMAVFDWGTDFGGSIRMPAGFCGIVGLRLSAQTWHVGRDHFPRLNPHFYSFCGMGPLARDVATAKRVVDALTSLRDPSASAVEMDRAVVIYGPDAPHRGEWPTFVADVSRLLMRADVRFDVARTLPAPERVRLIFASYLASHFDVFIDAEELGFWEGMGAVLLGILSRGRIDKRIHPNTGVLFGLLALGSLVFRDKQKARDALEALRERTQAIWSSGRLIVAPTSTLPPPRHGQAARELRLGTFSQLGNLTDATAIAIPFGRFSRTGLPRSLQIMGPAGSEASVLALAAKLERAIEESFEASV